MAVQDFQHTAQEGEEKASDFTHRLEQLFRLAYSRDAIPDER